MKNKFLRYYYAILSGIFLSLSPATAEGFDWQKKRLKYIDAISTFDVNKHKDPSGDDIEFLSLMRDSLGLDSIQIDDKELISLKDLPELPIDSAIKPKINYTIFDGHYSDSIVIADKQTIIHKVDSIISNKGPLSRYKNLLYNNNVLLIDLVHNGWKLTPLQADELKLSNLLPEKSYDPLNIISAEKKSDEAFITELREDTRRYLTEHALYYYTTTFDKLPDISEFMIRSIGGTEVSSLRVTQDKFNLGEQKIELASIKRKYWIKKANAMLQFSQNHISNNWHQGGNSNYSFLSILNGELNYNNQKNVIWENRMEWRIGYNKIQSERALRNMNINDDVLRYLMKFGLKAGGNWYYSVSSEATSQLFNNYQSFESDVIRARLFTPVRANVGVGMDYKYKNFSLTLAPLSFKYIYLNDTVNVNPNNFGIQKGENQLKQFGSTLRSELKLKPARDWNLDSRLSFYTDYKKVEVEMEIVNNFVINRFLTARLQINPRFDNTIILKEGEKSKIQYKELLSIGFAYRFI